jgi:hypothetical protein
MRKKDRKLEGKLRIDGAMSVYVNKDAERRQETRGQQGPDWNRKRDDNKILMMTGNGRITNFYDKG